MVDLVSHQLSLSNHVSDTLKGKGMVADIFLLKLHLESNLNL